MTACTNFRRAQSGAYLLEALIGILIFSFGILGIVGLQAQAIRFTNDAEIRAEATYLANSLISQMWTDNPAVIQTNYSSTPPGSAYVDFRDNKVSPALQGFMDPSFPPVVLVNDPSLPPPLSKNSNGTPSSVVQITIYWRSPGESSILHNYTTTGVIAQN
jgi:type IV pilus assembly protein PilV